MNSHMWLQAGSNVVCIAIGIFLGMAIAETYGAETTSWLFRWQTLIAGVLAVGAAGITVFQMQRTDERQQNRHDDLVWLNIRADSLRLERAKATCVDIIEATGRKIGAVLGEVAVAMDKDHRISHADASDLMERYDAAADLLNAALADNDLVAAQDLFGADVNSTVRSLRQRVKRMKNVSGPLRNLTRAPSGILHAGADRLVEEAWDEINEIPGLAREVAAGLTGLTGIYRRH